jgi:acyl-CoA synthetase (AMP-forming)/AMP-acid ligase II
LPKALWWPRPTNRYGEVVAAGLARQKTPERLLIVGGLPRTPQGKVNKAELRRMYFPDVSG